MQTYSLEILGTLLTIQIDTDIDCRKEFFEIEKLLRNFDQTFSRFKSGNWLDITNTMGYGELSADGKNMLQFALQLAKISGGYFDPTVIDLLEDIGYAKGFSPKNNQIPSIASLKKESRGMTYRDVEIRGDTCILHNQTRIEFGGIGKGYALDVLSKQLSHHDRFLINFGGDLSLRGGWNIGLEDPDNSAHVIGTLFIENGFFCASSGSKRKIGAYHHLLDPIHGGNSSICKGTYVFARSGILADSFATLAYIAPLEKTIKIYANLSTGNDDTNLLLRDDSLSLGILTSERRWITTPGLLEETLLIE